MNKYKIKKNIHNKTQIIEIEQVITKIYYHLNSLGEICKSHITV